MKTLYMSNKQYYIKNKKLLERFIIVFSRTYFIQKRMILNR